MLYRLLADAVVLVHLGFVVFVVCGGLLVVWRRWLAVVHLPAAAWGIGIEFAGGICPLTPLENRLRALAGDAAYSGDFVERYLMPVLYPPDLRRDVQIALGLFALAVNVAVYYYAWRRARSTPPVAANRAVGGRGASHLRALRQAQGVLSTSKDAGRTGEGHPSTDGNGPALRQAQGRPEQGRGADRTRSP